MFVGGCVGVVHDFMHTPCCLDLILALRFITFYHTRSIYKLYPPYVYHLQHVHPFIPHLFSKTLSMDDDKPALGFCSESEDEDLIFQSAASFSFGSYLAGSQTNSVPTVEKEASLSMSPPPFTDLHLEAMDEKRWKQMPSLEVSVFFR